MSDCEEGQAYEMGFEAGKAAPHTCNELGMAHLAGAKAERAATVLFLRRVADNGYRGFHTAATWMLDAADRIEGAHHYE